jgi:hypothetical protein
VSWDGRDASGRQAPSGVYFYQVDDGDRAASAKAVVVR